MSLDAIADLLSKHLGHDHDDTALWFSNLENPARLMLPPDGLPINHITEFVAEFLSDGFGFQLPNGFDRITALDSVALTALSVDYARIDPDTGDGGIGVFLELTLNTQWAPLGAVSGLGESLTLQDPSIGLGRAAEGGHWSLTLSGTLNLMGGAFHATADWPGHSYSADYVGDPIHIGKVLEKTGIPTAGLDFDVTEMSLSADTERDRFSAQLGIGKLTLGKLTLNNGHVAIERGSFKRTELSAVLSLPKLEIRLSTDISEASTQFSGRGKPTGDPIGLGELVEILIEALSGGAVNVDIPDALDALHVDAVELDYDTSDGSYCFKCEAMLLADGHEIDICFQVSVDAQGTQRPGGYIHVGRTKFDLQAVRSGGDSDGAEILAASYTPSHPFGFDLHKDVLTHVPNGATLAAALPDLEIKLQGAGYARVTPKSETKAVQVAGVALDASIDLLALPLVGSMAGGALAGSGIHNLQVLLSTGELSTGDVEDLNTLFAADPSQENPFQIPMPFAGDPDAPGLKKGVSFAGDIEINGLSQGMILGGGADDVATSPAPDPEQKASDQHARANPTTATSPVPAPAADAIWIGVQKKLGPLYLDKIGLAYRDAELWLLPDATLSFSSLSISLEGLAVSSPLDHFSPTFHLQGLGLEYSSGPIEISGAFLRVQEKDGDAYFGSAVLHTETLALSAMGSYARVHGEPSMFLYIDLNYPLGGPPFFFVTGLTAGFGYNRALTIPKIDELEKFPFVAAAMGKRPPPNTPAEPAEDGASVEAARNTLSTQLAGLKDYIAPEIGQNWLAAGVHFTSFEIVKGFALLSVAFGHRTEVHLLGAATFEYPPTTGADAKPLSRVDVVVDVCYLPDEGTLEVGAKIAHGSYVFDPACQLTGSLAFKTWFKGQYKNDFVLTIGGYHPQFKIPKAYPTAQRLAFNWQKSSAVVIKGQLYFAMTPNYLMAGGALEANYHSGALKAWLKISADFLIRYKPFHYDARMSVVIGAEVTIHFFGTHHISAHFSASLHLWGPSFSGKASFDIWVASFSVSFGDGADAPPPLTWAEFHTAFLPKDDPLITISTERGLVRALPRTKMTDDFDVIPTQDDTDEHWMINPYELSLVVNFVVPTNSDQNVGIAPMDLRREDFCSTALIDVLFGEQKINVTVDEFSQSAVYDSIPAGLWGNRYDLDAGTTTTVPNTVSTYRLKPGKPPLVGDSTRIDRDVLTFETEDMNDAFKIAETGDWATTHWTTLGEVAQAKDGLPDQTNKSPDMTARNALLAGLFSEQELEAFSGTLNSDDLIRKHVAKAPA